MFFFFCLFQDFFFVFDFLHSSMVCLNVDFLVFKLLGGVMRFLDLWFASVINFGKFSVITTLNTSAVLLFSF